MSKITNLFDTSKETATTRKCGTCGNIKGLEHFYKDGKDKDGNIKYRRDCKDCYNYTRILRPKNKRK